MFVISSLPREGGGCGGIRGNTAPSQQQTEYSLLLKTWFRADVVRRVLNLWNMDRRDIFIKCLSSLREINPSRRKFVPEKVWKIEIELWVAIDQVNVLLKRVFQCTGKWHLENALLYCNPLQCNDKEKYWEKVKSKNIEKNIKFCFTFDNFHFWLRVFSTITALMQP